MRFSSYILVFYFLIITVLPSVRAIKTQFGTVTAQECGYKGTDCEMGKLIAGLTFSAVQFIKELKINVKQESEIGYSKEQIQFFYILFLRSPFQNFIWRPPKILL